MYTVLNRHSSLVLFFVAIFLGVRFVNDRVILIVLRALQDIGTSLRIPSALNLLAQLFPDPSEQARAVGLFGATSAICNGKFSLSDCGIVANGDYTVVLGNIVGSILVQHASRRWIFRLIAIIFLSLSATCLYSIPPVPSHEDTKVS